MAPGSSNLSVPYFSFIGTGGIFSKLRESDMSSMFTAPNSSWEGRLLHQKKYTAAAMRAKATSTPMTAPATAPGAGLLGSGCGILDSVAAGVGVVAVVNTDVVVAVEIAVLEVTEVAFLVTVNVVVEYGVGSAATC